eukprot:scaffold74239_cov15-Tisochrysis_lutea.AAC.1
MPVGCTIKKGVGAERRTSVSLPVLLSPHPPPFWNLAQRAEQVPGRNAPNCCTEPCCLVLGWSWAEYGSDCTCVEVLRKGTSLVRQPSFHGRPAKLHDELDNLPIAIRYAVHEDDLVCNSLIPNGHDPGACSPMPTGSNETELCEDACGHMNLCLYCRRLKA